MLLTRKKFKRFTRIFVTRLKSRTCQLASLARSREQINELARKEVSPAETTWSEPQHQGVIVQPRISVSGWTHPCANLKMHKPRQSGVCCGEGGIRTLDSPIRTMTV